MIDTDARVYVAGHTGLVGSAIVRLLEQRGYRRIITRSRDELDLTSQPAVDAFFEKERPELVFLAAARVGGIRANMDRPAQFIRDNLLIQSLVIDAAYRWKARKLLFFGSSCVYPRAAPQPMREEYLLSGPLEPTNASYAVAKIAGIEMCRAYRRQYGFDAIVLMPTNLYGPNDNFDPLDSHVVAAVIRKIEQARRGGAKQVTLWGTGNPRRELLYVDDLADAALHFMSEYSAEPIVNIGTGKDLTIRELAERIAQIAGYRGAVHFDPSQPDGVVRKLLDVSRQITCGWSPSTSLDDGLRSTYRWFVSNREQQRDSDAGS